MNLFTQPFKIYFSCLLMLLHFGLKDVIAQNHQHYQHTTFWFRGLVTTPLSQNWDFFGEYLHRHQNDYKVSKINPFQEESFEEVRLWAFLKKKNITFQFNPFSYIYSKPFLGKETDYTAATNHEIRFAIGAELKQTQGKWTFKERVHYEYRFQKTDNKVPTGRTRLRGLVQYKLSKKDKLSLLSEFFFNVSPHKKPNFFDQNWTMLSLNRQLNPNIGLEIGYMRNIRERNSKTEFDDENALNLAIHLKL